MEVLRFDRRLTLRCQADGYRDLAGNGKTFCLHYYRDKVNDDASENNAACSYRTNSSKSITSGSFEYKAKRIGITPDSNSRLDAEVAVSLTYLSMF